MLAPIAPVQLNPLTRGLPDCLKTFVANTQDHILAACRDDDSACRRNPNSPIPTWSEVVQDTDKYGHRMGWIHSSSIKSQDHSRRVRKSTLKSPAIPNRSLLWASGPALVLLAGVLLACASWLPLACAQLLHTQAAATNMSSPAAPPLGMLLLLFLNNRVHWTVYV